MNYNLARPCKSCPFRRGDDAVRLDAARAREICETDGTFPCHMTTGAAGAKPKGGESHCAGFLLFHEKRGTSNNMIRIAERLRVLDRSALDLSVLDEIVDGPEEMTFAHRRTGYTVGRAERPIPELED